MWLAFGIAVLIGVLFGNGIPHFVSGISRKNYPSLAGEGAVPNLVGGWILFNLAGGLALFQCATLVANPVASAVGLSIGLLAIGLFHASGGAYRISGK
ncbi:hypothetical protein N8A98_20995 [Devosia neptuniae]|uniref:Uncharacterized protein n=1 Tax=Devosia neptuniae TaxID=191302 RepID=A0ABY6CEM6_9HYPH|nr:hypothetical protein [Devosia neptuniae]UXN69666.1 hypothetical protein N8A98_20995 [Devosia neptuniae]